MLILTRNRDEVVVLDLSKATDEELLSLRHTPIEIRPTDIVPGKVKLGFEAPKFVTVDRKEIHDEKRWREAAVEAFEQAA